jgi:hypothetical protein
MHASGEPRLARLNISPPRKPPYLSSNGVPDRLLQARVVQLLYSIRSERLLMEEVDDNILFRFCALQLHSHFGTGAVSATFSLPATDSLVR